MKFLNKFKEMNIFEEILGNQQLTGIDPSPNHPFDRDANGFAFELNHYVSIFCFEDPNDGYRSNMHNPMIVNSNLIYLGSKSASIVMDVPVKIRKHEDHNFDGIQVVDTRNKKVILELGTSSADDYYPSYVAYWNPENLHDNKPV